jgi:CcmD family protein
MSGDVIFVVSAYGVIFTAVTIYAVSLVRRLRRAERGDDPPEEAAGTTR